MATPGIAVPGSIVPASSLVGPGGAFGIQGIRGLRGAQGTPGPVQVSADAGNIARLGSDNLVYVALGGNYYGTGYVVSVASDFTLTTGVQVYVTTGGSVNSANPTLNVNGTGAIPIVNKAGIALFAGELPANKTFGVVYDGTNWRVTTFLCRVAVASNVTNPTIECAGYDQVRAYIQTTSNLGQGVTFAHLADGIPVIFDIVNAWTGGSVGAWIRCSAPDGTVGPAYWIWQNVTTGAAATRVDTPAFTINASSHWMAWGYSINNTFYCK